MNPSAFHIVILAAGKGTRMRSDKPKVLHTLAGQPLLAHVLATAKALKPASLNVVVGFKAEQVKAQVNDASVNWIIQPEQNGTGDAVACALAQMDVAAHDRILVLLGDVPLIDTETLSGLLELNPQAAVSLLTSVVEQPEGYGRIVRDVDGQVQAIVEQKDADAQTRAIKEVNTGIMLLKAEALLRWLPQLTPKNAQGELYLTDVIAMARADGLTVAAHIADAHWRTQGINDLVALSECERHYQIAQARALQRAGVQVIDPNRFSVRGQLQVQTDVMIDVGCVFEGTVVLESGVQIEPYCVLRDCVVGAGGRVCAYSHLEGATLGAGVQVGPYARLRPGTVLEAQAKVGNFVEIKNARLGERAKANHLSYVGDATIGADSNLGAGTITCNYDGANKHHTQVGAGVFVGSAVQLVAPVQVGENATIGAGSTITRNVSADTLAVARTRQKEISGWQRPVKTSKAKV